MSAISKNGKKIENLEAQIEKYDKVFLLDGDRDFQKKLCFLFTNSQAIKSLEKKVLVLYTEEISDEKAVSESQTLEQFWIDLFQIKESEYRDLLRLYYMYEFSDRFQVLSISSQYGSLFNYVDTEILDMEEVFQVLLH